MRSMISLVKGVLLTIPIDTALEGVRRCALSNFLRRKIMASIQDSLQELLTIEGALGAAVVDYESGMVLGSAGGGVDLELAGAGNARVIKAKMETKKSLGIDEQVIEDMLITLTSHFHIIRPTASHEGLFIYLVLDKARSNLALARHKVRAIEKVLEI